MIYRGASTAVFRIMAINAKQPEEFERMNNPLRSIFSPSSFPRRSLRRAPGVT